MKKAQDYLDEANAVVPKLATDEALALYDQSGVVFVDVRDAEAIKASGTIKGAARVPRGLIEFMADDSHALHNKALDKSQKIALVCAAGGQAALAGKTLKDMGFGDVVNIGGFGDWKTQGGPIEEG